MKIKYIVYGYDTERRRWQVWTSGFAWYETTISMEIGGRARSTPYLRIALKMTYLPGYMLKWPVNDLVCDGISS